MVDEDVSNPASLLQSNSVLTVTFDAKRKEPTGGMPSYIVQQLAATDFWPEHENLLASFWLASLLMHDASVLCNTVNRTEACCEHNNRREM